MYHERLNSVLGGVKCSACGLGEAYCFRITDWPLGLIVLVQLSHFITVSLDLSKVCWFTSLCSSKEIKFQQQKAFGTFYQEIMQFK